MVGVVQWSDHPGKAVLPNKSLFWEMKRLQPLAEVTMIRSTCESSWETLVERSLICMCVCVCVHLLRKFFLSGVFGIKRGKSWIFFFFFKSTFQWMNVWSRLAVSPKSEQGSSLLIVWLQRATLDHTIPLCSKISAYIRQEENCLIILRETLQTNKIKDKKNPWKRNG